MPALWPIVLVAANTALADMPKFSVEPTCRAVAAGAAPQRQQDACLRDEKQARGVLQKQWSGFKLADRQRCAAMTETGGLPSYVELLTCLQTADQAEKLPNKALEGPVK